MPRATSKPAAGVVIRDQHLQIDLRTVGFGKERLDLPPTPANIKYAERLRAEIMGKIERGTFSLADYFPDSPRVKRDAPSLTFKQLATEWLKIKTPELQHSTADHYEQVLSSYHFDDWREKRIVELDYRATMALLAKMPANPKTFNNSATVLRQVLEYGYKAKLLREPLFEAVEMRKHQSPGPDPFTMDEVEAILAALPDGPPRNYFEVAFFTGLRPSELIALRWSKVDKKTGYMKVDAALTRFQEKGTKTWSARNVELSARALQALERQRAAMGKRAVPAGHVFTSDEGAPFTTTDEPLRSWWKPAVKASKVRTRDARQTRHTFATMCLMAGLTPGWVAMQMGHSPEMFFRVYSRWIQGADQGAERRKLDAFLGDKTGTENGTGTAN